MGDKKVPVECYTRVVGYFRPDSHTNKGKKEEIDNRKFVSHKKIREKLHEEMNMKGRVNGQV
jgi:anaerobic ribonucleoside-triphosphate reductase